MLRGFCLSLLLVCAACGGGSTTANPPPPIASPALDLSPVPLALTSDAIAQTFVVQNDVAGISYTATALPGCVSSSGGIYVSGDGMALTAVAGEPTMFLAVAVGMPPAAACTISVSDNTGNTSTLPATYETIVTQSVHRTPLALTKSIVAPASVTIARLNDVVPVTVSGFTGTVTIGAGSCAKPGGISVLPNTLANGGGTFVIAPFGVGAISRPCTVTLTDTAGGSATIAVTLSVPALNKFTASTGTLQFGCAGSGDPLHCRTLQTATLNETGATAFQIAPRAFPDTSCVTRFQGPLQMVSGTSSAVTAPGPTASVAFDGLLLSRPIGCTRIPISDGGNPAQIVSVKIQPSLASAPPPALPAATAPPCTGTDSHVAVPTAPHGMYAWSPGGRDTALLQKYAIDIDPTLCGASIVIDWKDIEPSKGTFDFSSVETTAAPWTGAKTPLTVNLLFEDTTEGSTEETPAWVMAEVPNYACQDPPASQAIPAYWNATYEADWTDLIAHAIAYFSNTSPIRAHVGYMRFAVGGGAEALPPPGYNDNGTCQLAWANLGYSYDTWLTHTINIVTAMAAAKTAAGSTHQLIASLPDVSGGATVYAMSNAFAAVAASKGVGFSFENLGAHNVAIAGTTPAACNPNEMISDLHWCQPYTNFAGVVPLAMQPLHATTNTAVVPPADISLLLPYALDNNIQIFELYPDEWLEADGGPDWDPFVAANQPKYKAALQAASLVLGATNEN